MRIRGAAEVGDKFWQRIREVFVVAEAEAVAFHYHLAAETGWLVVEGDNGRAFFGREDLISNGVAPGR